MEGVTATQTQYQYTPIYCIRFWFFVKYYYSCVSTKGRRNGFLGIIISISNSEINTNPRASNTDRGMLVGGVTRGTRFIGRVSLRQTCWDVEQAASSCSTCSTAGNSFCFCSHCSSSWSRQELRRKLQFMSVIY